METSAVLSIRRRVGRVVDMVMDQGTLLIAAGICAAGLSMTASSVWLTNRADRFVLGWILSLGLLGGGVITYVLSPSDSAMLTASAFLMMTVGFVTVLAAARMFIGAPISRPVFAGLGLASLAVVVPPILAGFGGVGIMIFNFVAAGLLFATGAQYWSARAEAPLYVSAIIALYGVSALSFVLCGGVLAYEGHWVLAARPDNWAEQFNAIMCLIGITGIGALSLALNQVRVARKHRMEARTDALTGLLNRRALFETLARDGLGARDAVVAFDLDQFKSINDRYGHAVGDEVLRRFAAILSRHVREKDLVARIGGEEFVLVMSDTSAQLASGTAERIRAGFAASRLLTAGGTLFATASAGVALAERAGESFESVLHRADASLYRAKDGGRDRVVTALQAVA